MGDRYFSSRRILESGGNNGTHRAGNPPDRPLVESYEVTATPGSWAERGNSLTFVQTSPVLPYQRVAIGGTRTIGGGISTEALRRARKKQRRRA